MSSFKLQLQLPAPYVQGLGSCEYLPVQSSPDAEGEQESLLIVTWSPPDADEELT